MIKREKHLFGFDFGAREKGKLKQNVHSIWGMSYIL